MTITAQVPRSGPEAGDGTTVAFTYGFLIDADTELVVTVRNTSTEVLTIKTLTTDYSVAGAGNVAGGTVTFVTAPTATEQVAFTRAVPLVQGLDLQNRGVVSPSLLEQKYDDLYRVAQDNAEALGRAVKVDIFNVVDVDQLTANLTVLAGISGEITTVAGLEAAIGTVNGDAADIATVAGISADVSSVAAIDTDVTAVAGIAANVTTVAGVAANVTTVAGVSTDVTTVAGINAAVTTVAADGADIGTVAGISADVSTVAGISAAVTTAAGDSAVITQVAADTIPINAASANATSAANSAAAAAASYDDFDDRYLGAKAVAPTLDNDGAALLTGAIYFDTALDQMRFYNGTVWSVAFAPTTDTLLESELTDVASVKALDQGVATTDSVTFADLTVDAATITAIAASKAITAVDGFVYDTSKDSDGGSWRERCQHTSWYREALNTATRGATRKFPAVAVIIAETTKVTIYDGDDPALPMWMVFTGGLTGANVSGTAGASTVQAISMLGGIMVAGNSGAVNEYQSGLTLASFVSDTFSIIRGAALGYYRIGDGTIKDRNANTLGASVDSTTLLVSGFCNDVAMTVLSDAPIDAATGLPTPTIAVGTDGGMSVINNDGTVADSTITQSITSVAFDDDVLLWNRADTEVTRWTTSDLYVSDGFAASYEFNSTTVPAVFDGTTSALREKKSAGYPQGLILFENDPTTPANGMVAYVASDYSTGYMVGDIKGAFLSSVDTASLVGTELVTNGTFDTVADGVDGYDNGDGTVDGYTIGNGASLSVVSTRLRITGDGTSSFPYAQYVLTTVAGQAYSVTIDANAPSYSWYIEATALGLATTSDTATAKSLSFVAAGSTTTIRVIHRGATNGNFVDIDNFLSRLADEDRSVNAKGAAAYGTITRTAVATGADLVAYSGFYASNYLEQPYNADLDFGTGDFSIMGWFKSTETSTSTKQLFERGDRAGGFSGGGQISIEMDGAVTAGALEINITDDDFATVDTARTPSVYDDGVWRRVTFTKSGTSLEIRVNGVLEVATTITAALGSLNNTAATMTFGARPAGALPFDTGSMALWRISATAPTAAQDKAIYEAEKGLFTESAKAVLPADAVTALAFDDETKTLKIGTASGMAEMQEGSLVIVDQDAVAVTTFISSSDELEIKQ